MNSTNTKATRISRMLLGLAAVLLAHGLASSARAQGIRIEQDAAVLRVQSAVRERILREQGGREPIVSFNYDAQRYQVANNQIGVRGTGLYRRNSGRDRDRDRRFSYEGVYHSRRNSVENVTYRLFEADDDNDGDSNVPDWLRGTFTGRNPRSRRQMTVRINRRGNVIARFDDGAEERGTYSDGMIRFGESLAWRVSRAADGFEARDGNFSRRAERFRRTSGNDNDDDDNDGRIPRWAIGTFRGTTDSGESQLSIAPDGTAVALSITRGRSFNGRYDGDTLRFEFGSFRLERDGDGIRTIEVGNRNNQTSYRRVN